MTGSRLSEGFGDVEEAVTGSVCSALVGEVESRVGPSAGAEVAGAVEEGWSSAASFSIFSKPYSLFLSATGSNVLFSFRGLSVSSDPSNDLFSLSSCSELSELDGAARAGDQLSRTVPEVLSIFGRDGSWDCTAEVKISRSRGRLAFESMLGRDDSCDLRSFSRSSSTRL